MFSLFQNKSESCMKGYIDGLGASFPIVLGYFPVAIAFGLTAKGAGFSSFGAALISALIFAGASQFALVGMIAGGSSVLAASLVCLALNARHLVYGPSLSTKVREGVVRYIPLVSFGLTDEVFSTSLSEIEKIDKNKQTAWLLGLESGAYFTWTFATWIGAFSGDMVVHYLPALESALSFALPALFLTLIILMIDKKTVIPVAFSAIVSVLFNKMSLEAYSILAASVSGPLAWFLMRRVYDN